MHFSGVTFAGTFSGLTIEHPAGTVPLMTEPVITSRRASQPKLQQAGNVLDAELRSMLNAAKNYHGARITLICRPSATEITWENTGLMSQSKPVATHFTPAILKISAKDEAATQGADEMIKEALTKKGVKFSYSA